MEEAEGIREMLERFGWTQDRVSKEFGKSQNWVNLRLSLLQLDVPIQQKIIERSINSTQAGQIARAPKNLQSAIADKVVRVELSSRDKKLLVKLADRSLSDWLAERCETTERYRG
ncbi:ParB/RepB/Spo0J family partition protein [Cohnella herbarum]|uniref:ParB/RepB/Spo0J family partition protein n=1 Tax=Cohnella herbarum TaxID=2728023 RepID=UPI004046B303